MDNDEVSDRLNAPTERYLNREPDPENEPELADFQDYLNSDRWKRAQRRIFKRDNYKCVRCNGRAQLVHHRSYDKSVFRDESDEMLVSLCRGCHNLIEFYSDGYKRRDLDEKDRILFDTSYGVQLPHPTSIKCSQARNLEKPNNFQRATAMQRRIWESVNHLEKQKSWAEKYMKRLHTDARRRYPIKPRIEKIESKNTDYNWIEIEEVHLDTGRRRGWVAGRLYCSSDLAWLDVAAGKRALGNSIGGSRGLVRSGMHPFKIALNAEENIRENGIIRVLTVDGAESEGVHAVTRVRLW